MPLLSIPRSFVLWDLSRLESTSLSPIFSFAISVRAPVPARLPWEPAPICFFPPFAMGFSFRASQEHSTARLLLFRRPGPLRPVTALSGIIVFVVIAFLVEAAATNRPFALPRAPLCLVQRIVTPGAVCEFFRQPSIGNIRLALQNANLLLVGFPALQGSLGFLALHDRSPIMHCLAITAALVGRRRGSHFYQCRRRHLRRSPDHLLSCWHLATLRDHPDWLPPMLHLLTLQSADCSANPNRSVFSFLRAWSYHSPPPFSAGSWV